jgi:hypothetical protein
MRADAEAQLRRLGLWTKRGALPLEVYTLGRYIAAEVGSGTPEEKVAVAEAALHRTHGTATTTGWYPNGSVNNLLLYRQAPSHPNYGRYGPIHDDQGRSPYDRWASTSRDPGIDDLLIADFVYRGKSNNFSRGSVTQYGAEYLSNPLNVVTNQSQSGSYWVGPLPGVDHWHTLLFVQDKRITPSSHLGQTLIERAKSALAKPMVRPTWSHLSLCKKPGVPAGAVAAIALLAGLSLAYATATWLEPTWRGTRYHTMNTDPILWSRFSRFDPWNS